MSAKDTENLQEFLRGLKKLTARYGLEVGGCGDCGSPWVRPVGDSRVALEHLKYCTVHKAYGAYADHEDCD